MNKLFLLPLLLFFLSSCTKESDPKFVGQSVALDSRGHTDILKFSSQEELAEALDAMKVTETCEIVSYTTRTRSAPNDQFTSLKNYLTERGLREFSEAELAEIAAESLEYEPEDSLVIDPYLASVLNKDREIQIGDKIHRFVEEGLLIYAAADKCRFNAEWKTQTDVSGLSHGQRIPVHAGEFRAELVKIDYLSYEDIEIDAEDFELMDEMPMSRTVVTSRGIRLANGDFVPADKIRRTTYRKGGGNSSWLAKSVSGVFGKNVTLTNNFDKRHRMKLRMYEQDYVIYRAVGMTVRMQQRRLRIWWRKKAQEFRYGWTAIECEYKFPKPAFLEPPKMPNGMPKYNKYPTAMNKKFPFEDSKIVLFHIPIANYDVTTGDVNNVMTSGMKYLTQTIQGWFNDPQNKSMRNNPRGLFTTLDGDKKIRVIFPQGEERDTGTGREVVRWDKQWFSGNFMLGFKSNLAGGGFKYDKASFSPAKDVSIIRGRIYGAVKYNGEWRACIIETE